MRRYKWAAAAVIAAGLALVCLAVSGPALSSPSPTPTATPTPAPTYASSEYVRQVKALHHQVLTTRHTLCRVRACFGQHAPRPACSLPLRGALLGEWRRAERRLRHELKDWKGKVKAGRHRMLKPGGSSNGRRWIPLMRWLHYPAVMLNWFAAIIMRESSGRERAYNPVIGCSGLLQIWPGNLRPGERASDLFHAEFNLRVGLRLYRECGTAPWAL